MFGATYKLVVVDPEAMIVRLSPTLATTLRVLLPTALPVLALGGLYLYGRHLEKEGERLSSELPPNVMEFKHS
jgi:hypothetical protein